MLTHVDLFSGIGGFALAAKWAGFRTEVFCEIDKFCQAVLQERFGAIEDARCQLHEGSEVKDNRTSENHGRDAILNKRPNCPPRLISDIRDFDGRQFRGATLLTGGFPCQPFSVAGKRKGKADDRHLWPEMLRVISEARPAWVVGENVAGIINMELEQVCLDLEAEGYEVQPVIIPACAVNAPHRRSRVWIIGYSKPIRLQHSCGESEEISRRQGPPENANSDAPDATRGRKESGAERGSRNQRHQADGWDTPWPEVAARLCGMDDGISRRVDRLKSLGNAIVPQCALPILQEIAKIEREKT
jgi:DNA (cytosine-5)-methyltransferase 1